MNDDDNCPPDYGDARPRSHKARTIRDLNDELRRNARGGSWVITHGISGLGPSQVNQILKAVAAFDAFTTDNDPFGEHDCAVMTVSDIQIIWKIDCYDTRRQYGSPDPADPQRTSRVLTVMRADEY